MSYELFLCSSATLTSFTKKLTSNKDTTNSLYKNQGKSVSNIMSVLGPSWGKRTLLAFAVRCVRNQRPYSPTLTTRHLASSSFNPPEPPGTTGTPVFPDIDFSVRNKPDSESAQRNQDPNAVFVVTGASRGIGLQFCASLVERTEGTIVACCRSPEESVGLQKLVSIHGDRIVSVPFDLENQQSIEDAAVQIQSQFDRVDLLLNVAGLLGNADTDAGPERALSQIDRSWMEKSLAVNLIGPVMFTQQLTILLTQQKRKRTRAKAVVANLSARVGSISDNGLGGWYSYRISKAGLNQATCTMALEFKRRATWCVALHPGTTETDLSKPFQKNVQKDRLFPVEFTVSQLLDVIDSLEDWNSGGFYDWAGQSISF